MSFGHDFVEMVIFGDIWQLEDLGWVASLLNSLKTVHEANAFH